MKMYVAGAWSSGIHQEEVRSPYDGSVVDDVPVAGAEDVEEALAAAELGAKRARALSADERFRVLLRAADLADQHAEQLAKTISSECGKTIAEARGRGVARRANFSPVCIRGRPALRPLIAA